MNKFCKTTAMLFALSISAKNLNAQTTYGVGAGTKGATSSFFGQNAGKVNSSLGVGNTFVGQNAGLANTAGTSNTFMGLAAGAENTQGSFNTFLGEGSGLHNKMGSHNSFLGYQSGLYNVSGENNTFLGYYSGQANGTGSANLYLGAYAGYQRTSGNYNSIIGPFANCFGGGGNNNNIIGYKAGAFNNGSDNVFVGNESGYINGLGTYNAFLGSQTGHSNTTGNNNAFFGYGAGYTNTTGEKNTYLGYASGGNANLVNATAIGAQAKVTASNSLVLGNNANVGIGLGAPAYQLQLSTDLAAKAGSKEWTVMSDRRLKKDISNFSDGLNVLKQINPVWFRYNGKAEIKTGDKKFVGIIAQDMQKIAPYTIGSFNYQDSLGNKTEYLDYDANAVTYILINSVKEQQKIIDDKDAEIQQLGRDVSDLKQRLEKLESLLKSSAVASGNNLAASKESADGVVLEQNAPNPVAKSAVIRFYIPQSVKSATLQVHNNDGVEIGTYPIEDRGSGQFTFHANTLNSGIYLYDLITDGKASGAKKMVITK